MRRRLSRGRPLRRNVPHAHHRSRPHAPTLFSVQARAETRRVSGQPLQARPRFGNSQRSAIAPTAQTTIVPPTSVQKPSMWKPLTITSVSQRMNIATKNHAIPSVRIASGKVSELQDRLDERREDPVDERRDDQRPGRAADRDAGEDPRRDRERSGVDGPADEETERERHVAIVTGRPSVAGTTSSQQPLSATLTARNCAIPASSSSATVRRGRRADFRASSR